MYCQHEFEAAYTPKAKKAVIWYVVISRGCQWMQMCGWGWFVEAVLVLIFLMLRNSGKGWRIILVIP